MRAASCCLLAAILTTGGAQSDFRASVTKMHTFPELVAVAQREAAERTAFLAEQVRRYNASTKELTKMASTLSDQYDPYMRKVSVFAPRLWKCYLYKIYYYLARWCSLSYVRWLSGRNMTKALTNRYAAASKQLEANVQSVQQMAAQAQKARDSIGQAKAMILRAHRRYYDNMAKYFGRYIQDTRISASMKRGTMTVRGKMLLKCVL